MALYGNLWLPMSDSTNASPGDRDFNKVLNSQMVQSARVDNLFVSRMLANTTPMHMGNGYISRDVDFTLTGGIGTETHQKNDRYTGMNINQIQRTISLDERPRRTGIEEESITKMFEQVNVRGDILNQLGYALASWDEVEGMKAIADASAYTAAGSENTTEFLPGGGSVTLAAGATHGSAKALDILDAIEDTVILWGQKGVPNDGRYLIVAPEDYWEIVKLEQGYDGATAIAGGIFGNMDLAGNKTALSEFVNIGTPLAYRGVQIFGHNLFKATYNIHLNGLRSTHTIDSDHGSRGSVYDAGGDLSNIEGLLFQKDCVGKADVMSISMEQGQVPMSTNEYLNAMVWVGYGTLRPEAAVVLASS